MAGSLAAAFAAGMVAFFAPCCAGVMMPAYLAAIGGGRRMRVARLTAVYVAGVSVVVLPITLGAAALASYVSKWHPQMFTIGGLMLGIAYVAGMMTPLIPLALVYGKARNRVRDPKLTLRLGAYAKRIGVARLSGVVVFAGFGFLFILLALTGNSDSAPGFQ